MKQWKDCGYVAKTKNPKVLAVKIKGERYILNLKDINDVLNDKLEYALIFERITEEKVIN